MSTSGEVDPSVTSAFGALSIGTTTSASSTSNSTEARKSGVQSIKVEGKEEGKSQQQAKKQPPGASWVDYPNLSQDEKDALTEKKFGVDVVVVKDLVKQFSLPGREEKVRALKGVNLCEGSEIYPIRQGEFVMIRGPSGGGKTTLLNILGTIDEPSSGTVEIFGETVSAESSDAFLADLRLRRIGFVFQTFNLLATMSAFENVELPMVVLGNLSASGCRKRALHLLDIVGLADRAQHLPSELSGGEQQRTTIARALANEPQLLLLDEPTGDLDTRNTIDIMDLLLKLNQERGVTLIMVTHNPDLECYADRILYVEDGTFKKQAINKKQMKLEYATYMEHIAKAHERTALQRFEED